MVPTPSECITSSCLETIKEFTRVVWLYSDFYESYNPSFMRVISHSDYVVQVHSKKKKKIKK